MKTKAPDPGSEDTGRLYLRLAVPVVVARIANILYNTVDRIFIGRIPGIGAEALSGVGVQPYSARNRSPISWRS